MDILLDCVYSKDKLKKNKKFKDGYITMKNKKIILYDENKKEIYKTLNYKKDENDYYVTQIYLIYFEGDINTNIENNENKSIENVKVVDKNFNVNNELKKNNINHKNDTENAIYLSENEKYNFNKEIKKGRKNSEILNLLKFFK